MLSESCAEVCKEMLQANVSDEASLHEHCRTHGHASFGAHALWTQYLRRTIWDAVSETYPLRRPSSHSSLPCRFDHVGERDLCLGPAARFQPTIRIDPQALSRDYSRGPVEKSYHALNSGHLG
jgi:hypothetical protein